MKKLALFFLVLFSAPFLFPAFASADTTVSGTISSNQTWTLASSTYIVSSTVTINSGVTLTINPGVVVKFIGLSFIVNNGTLNAQGSTSSPIYFTSYQDDSIGGNTNGGGTSTGASSNWRAIQTNAGATTTISNAELRFSTWGFYNFGGVQILTSVTSTTSAYGLLHESGTSTATTSFFGNNANYGIYIGGPGTGAVTIASSTITKNSAANVYGLYARGTAALTVTNNSFATNTNALQIDYIDGGPSSFTHGGNSAWGNPTNGILLANGASFTGSKTWTSDTIPYVVTNEFKISLGKTLTINPGAVVKFFDTGSYLTVSGTLNVQGSTSSPVYFTSLRDDAVGGDTNANGTTNVPNGGDWEYILFPVNGTSTIDHAIIRYGGVVSGAGMVYENGGYTTITNSEIASSSYNGVYNNNGSQIGTINISYSDIHDNGTSTGTYYGILHSTGGTTTIDHSTIRNHRSYGINAASGTGFLSLTNSTVSNNNAGVALINLAQNLTFTHYYNTATGTGKGGIVIYGTPGKNQTWYGDPYLPYIISSATGTVTINTYAITLSPSNPSAIFKFEGATANITVNSGSFIMDSRTSTTKTYFTSIKDDGVGGDTNGNGAANSSAAGDWDGIKVNSGAVASTTYVVMRYGGNTVTGSSKMLWNNGGTLAVENAEIASSSSSGIYQTAGFTTI